MEEVKTQEESKKADAMPEENSSKQTFHKMFIKEEPDTNVHVSDAIYNTTICDPRDMVETCMKEDDVQNNDNMKVHVSDAIDITTICDPRIMVETCMKEDVVQNNDNMNADAIPGGNSPTQPFYDVSIKEELDPKVHVSDAIDITTICDPRNMVETCMKEDDVQNNDNRTADSIPNGKSPTQPFYDVSIKEELDPKVHDNTSSGAVDIITSCDPRDMVETCMKEDDVPNNDSMVYCSMLASQIVEAQLQPQGEGYMEQADYLTEYSSTFIQFYSCTQCPFKATYTSLLKRHMRESHAGEKLKCSQCNFTTTRNNDLKMHIRTHTGEKPFTCKYCSNSFAQQSHLVRHMRCHTGEKPFSCTHCQYSCARKSEITWHMSTHTGVKPFACSQCPYTSVRKGDLTVHMRLHTGKKPFTCSNCPYATAVKNNLKKHMKTHARGKYTCSNCSFSCKNKIKMKEHVKICRKEEKPVHNTRLRSNPRPMRTVNSKVN